MVVGRFFRGLTAYDLLGNLVPGVILLTASILFFPDGWLPSSVGTSVLFALFAYLLGGVVQEYASSATGDRSSFNQSIAVGTELDRLEISANPPDRTDDSTSGTGQLLRKSFLYPISFASEEQHGTPVEERVLASQVRQHIYNQHDLEPRSVSPEVFYRLMLSEITATDHRPTAVRMQALRNLYRGVWIASWVVLLLVLVSLAIQRVLVGCEYLPIQFHPAGYYRIWPHLWQLLPPTLGAVVAFRYLNKQRNRKFVEYLFTDYAAAVSLSGSTTTESSGEEQSN